MFHVKQKGRYNEIFYIYVNIDIHRNETLSHFQVISRECIRIQLKVYVSKSNTMDKMSIDADIKAYYLGHYI